MSKKNNRRAHRERFNIIAKAQFHDELRKSQKRITKHIQKSVLNQIGDLTIAKFHDLKTSDIEMKNLKKSKAPQGYIRRRDKKIIDAIKKRERKRAKTTSMKLD